MELLILDSGSDLQTGAALLRSRSYEPPRSSTLDSSGDKTILFNVAENETGLGRFASIRLESADGSSVCSYQIAQSAGYDEGETNAMILTPTVEEAAALRSGVETAITVNTVNADGFVIKIMDLEDRVLTAERFAAPSATMWYTFEEGDYLLMVCPFRGDEPGGPRKAA